MFITYDMVNFGLCIKEIRKSNHMTQLDVQKKTMIHLDTLRRIENGTTLPKYETLELLSKLFHVDLLEVLKSKRIDNKLYSLYNKMDDLLLSNNVANLSSMKDELSALLESYDKINYLIDRNELKQFQIFIDICQLFYTDSPEELKKAKGMILGILETSNTSFSVEKIDHYNYSEFELRLLFVLGTIDMCLELYQGSIKILNFLIDKISSQPILNSHSKKLLLKSFTNLAYCYHLDDDHINALTFANQGIDFAVDNEIFYMLHSLYARKAIAEFNLSDLNHINSFKKSIHLLEISKQTDLADKYKTIFKDQYHMTFSD